MSVESVLSLALKAGLVLWVEGGRVRFRAPPGALDDTLKAALQGVKDALAAHIGEGRRLAPAFAGQRRLWLADAAGRGDGAYTVSVAAWLDGPLDRTALAAALDGLAVRHAALRTRLMLVGDQPAQLIEPTARLPLAEAHAADDAAALALAGAAAKHPFDPAAAPLARALLVRVGEERGLFVLMLHHAICDADSVETLGADLAALYAGTLSGNPEGYPYADFAAGQQHRAERGLDAADIAFWCRRLNGVPVLDLGAEPLVPPAGSPVGRVSAVLNATDTAAVLAQGRGVGATPYMTVLGLLAGFLRRWSGQGDVAIGSPVSLRGPEHARVVGFFADTVALRLDLDRADDATTLVGRARAAVTEALAHAGTPFDRVVQALGVAGAGGDGPVFQVLFTHRDAAGTAAPAALGGDGLRQTPVALPPAAPKLMLTVETATDAAGCLTLSLEYDRARVDDALAAALAEGFLAFCRDPGAAPAVAGLSGPATVYPRDASIPAVFARVAAGTPDAVAVVYDDATLSYDDLDRRSGAVAAGLAGRGVRPGDVVAVALERSAAMVVAWLGVLKAGAAYLPLDPAVPAERLAFMEADSGARLVLDADALAALERDPPSTPPRLPAVAGGATAYVIYTSGSTGRPKGTAVPHRAVLRLVLGCDYAPLAPDHRVAQMANAAFDAVTFEVWGPLLNGGRVVGIDADTALSADALAAALRAGGVTHLFLTTALFNAVVRERADAFATLDTLLVGGESLDPAACAAVLQAGPPGRFANIYGPTEVTTFATWHPITAVAPGTVGIPIGRPIANTTAHVLGPDLRPVPAGAVGELWLGGDGVALGYPGRPDLTAERFRPDPFAARPGARLYHTGDRVRLLPGGVIDFRGRADTQVKIRGFRVEPGEVEAALRALPGVGSAHVAARRDAGGTWALVAYLVAVPGGGLPGEAAVRAALGGTLPDYMIPAAFVALERLPLTVNGKIDAAALPAPERMAATAFQPPRGPAETLVAQAMAEVLGLERLGRDEDFFHRGGHSLAAMRLVARLKERAGAAIPLRLVFEDPTPAALAAHLGDALPADGAVSPIPAAPIADGGAIPLSYGQERLWFIHRLQPDQRAYLIPLAVRLTGPLAVEALAAAATALLARHGALRTGFATVDGRPLAVEHPPEPLPVPVEDIAPAALDAALAAETSRPFDLERGPLIRLRLFRLGREDHVLALTLHHIAADGWSLGVLLRELAALVRDPRAPLPPLPLRYPDFAAWQKGRDAGAALAYWRRTLAGAPTLELPADRPRPAAGVSHAGGMVHRRLPDALWRRLEDEAGRQGASLFMVLLAGVAALLARLADEDDVVVGTVLAGRDHPDTEGLVGLFIQTLPLRLDLGGNPALSTVVERARAAVLDAHAHGGVPFERIVEAVDPVRDPTRTPLFQVMVLLQNQPYDTAVFPGLTAEPLPLPPAGAKYDLTLAFSGDQRGVGIEYSAALFDAATVERLADRLVRVLAALAADPAVRLAHLPLLDDGERAAALALGRGPAAVEPVSPLLTWGGTGDDPALIAADGTVGYGEFRARVERLAGVLAAHGAGPEVRVGLCGRRGGDQVVALLAVLAAGAAYVPLDPDLPPDRLAAMVADAAPAFVLADDAGAAVLPPEVRRLPLAGDGVAPRPLRPAPAGAAAYVLFTSGSTGRPKGVVVERDALARHMAWMDRALPLAPGDRLLLKTPMGFDASVWEYLAAFRAGAALVVADPQAHREPAALVRAVVAGGVTVAQFVPSVLAAMAAEPGFAGCRSLRRVCCGGEGLPRALAQRVACDLGAEIVNLYGPTEATIQTVVQVGIPPGSGATLPIGRAIDGVQAFLTDRWGQPVPLGYPGRLWLAGTALARGYLGRPDLTAERFRPHPFPPHPGRRALDTGDRARFLPDGSLEWLGRTDGQIKLRGYRIELGEVEAVLRRQSGVTDAVALVETGGEGGERLVAYAVPAGLSAGTLAAGLAAALPPPMRPAALVLLDTLPRLPSGKVDRRALPRPDARAAAAEPPAGPVEETLAALWSTLLGGTAVGRGDDFFALGGHSLLAAQLVARVRDAFAIDLPVTAVFEAPTLAALARRIAEGGRDDGPIPRLPRGGPLPPSAAQRRLWTAVKLHGDGGRYTMGGALRLRGRLDRGALERALAELVRRHDSLRTHFPEDPDTHLPQQRITPPAAWALPVRSVAGVGEAEALAADLLRAPFALDTGPLFRATLVDAGAEGHVLVLAIHHIVSDGWSMRVLTGELVALYEAFAAGRPSPLPELTVQYADYAAWHDAAAARRRDEALSYWRRHLIGAPALALPAVRPDADAGDTRGASRGVMLGGDVTAAVERLARVGGGTGFMVLLAGFAAALHATTGQADLVVGTDVADRLRREAEGLIGFFVNQVALRLDLSGDPTGGALVGRVRAVALDAFARQSVSFDDVVAALGPRLGDAPLLRAKFTVQDAVAGAAAMGGLALDYLSLDPPGVPFDLTVNLVRTQAGYAGGFLYRPALFDTVTIDRLAGRFKDMLAALTADPERSLSSLVAGLGPANAKEASLAKLRTRRR